METIQGIAFRKTLNVNVGFFYVFNLYANLNLNMQNIQPLVIMVWMQNPLAGLGDLLRGTVHLHELSQRLNFRLIIDTQLHPISNFLNSTSHEYSEYVLQNKDKVINLVNSSNSIDIIKKCLLHPDSKIKPILLISNNIDSIYTNPTAHARSFIRTLLNPTQDFKEQFNSMCNEFKIARNYSILHLRLGDDDLVRHAINVQKYKEILPIIDANVHPNDNILIISDSFIFKQYLRNVRPHLANRIVPTQPVHLSHSTDKDAHMIKETLFDLFLLMNSRTIKTYTTYTWISGFVQWVSHAFNIPLISINHSNIKFMTTEKKQHVTPHVMFNKSNPTKLINMQMKINIRENTAPKPIPTLMNFKLNKL